MDLFKTILLSVGIVLMIVIGLFLFVMVLAAPVFVVIYMIGEIAKALI